MNQSPERLAAEKFCRDNDLPLSGYVCLHHGTPFQWQKNRPRPQSVVPGVVALCLDDNSRYVAIGGSIDGGANQWEDALPPPRRRVLPAKFVCFSDGRRIRRYTRDDEPNSWTEWQWQADYGGWVFFDNIGTEFAMRAFMESPEVYAACDSPNESDHA